MPPKNKLCAGCRNELQNNYCLDCPTCKKTYDLSCANVSERKYRAMDADQKKKWCCQECVSKKPRNNDNNTPVRSNVTTTGVSAKPNAAAAAAASAATTHCSPDSDIVRTTQTRVHTPLSESTSDSQGRPQGSGQVQCDESLSMGNLSQMIQNEIRLALKKEIPSLIKRLFEAELSPIRSQLNTIEESTSFTSAKFDELAQKIETMTHDHKKLKSECEYLRQAVTDMQTRLNAAEQHMRNSNIEIQGVPEHRSENVVTVVKQIAQVVSCKLNDEDILSCTRVASVNKQTNRPRAIVVKLRSPRCRDELYSSVSRYNKSNPKEKLNSSHVGIGGEKVPVFVSEHLSPANKALHASARIKARELGFKYVWVRNGQIFMRKDDTSRFVHVKNENTLALLTKQTSN